MVPVLLILRTRSLGGAYGKKSCALYLNSSFFSPWTGSST